MIRRRILETLPAWGGVGVGLRSYSDVLINDYGASEVWVLSDMTSGTTIPAKVSAARNGTATGWDLQNVAGPVPGTLTIYSDGANDKGDVYSASLAAIHNGAEISIFWWMYINVAWTEAVSRVCFILQADGNNRVVGFRPSSPATGVMNLETRGGGVLKTHAQSMAGEAAGWHSYGISRSESADTAKFYYDGNLVSTQNTIGTWSGALNSSSCLIGAVSTTPTLVWKGWLDYPCVKYDTVWNDADYLAMHNAAATSRGG